MKIILLVAIIAAFLGCGSDYKTVLPEESGNGCDDFLSHILREFEIKDTIGLKITGFSLYFEGFDTCQCFSGIKKGKLWINFQTKEKKEKFVFIDEDDFKFNRVADLGYGRFDTVNVKPSNPKFYVCDNGDFYGTISCGLDLGHNIYAVVTDFISMIDGNKKVISDFGYSFERKWTKDHFIAEKWCSYSSEYYMVSKYGEVLFNIKKNNYYMHEYIIPINITDGLNYNINKVQRLNLKTGDILWKLSINNDIDNNATNRPISKISVNDKNGSIYDLKFDITYFDGKKETRIIRIDIETGNIKL
ncbi:MAG: hypothetical protein RR854_00460 [Muribaculaceae bacterium]